MKTDLFTKLFLLIIAGCLVVLVVRGITVTHKSYKPRVKASRYNPFIEDMKK